LHVRRIGRLNPEFRFEEIPDNELILNTCTLSGITSVHTLTLYENPKARVCIRFDFILNQASFRKAVGDTTFGVFPLIMEAAFKALPKMPGTYIQWSHGYNMEDIAADIQKLLTLVTPLIMERHPISDILENKPTGADFKAILDSAEKSPVFMVNSNGVHIVASKSTDGWKGYDIKNPTAILAWTESDLKSKTLSASLIYNADHKAIVKPADVSCEWGRTFPSNSYDIEPA
jgi:hypothetical protein